MPPLTDALRRRLSALLLVAGVGGAAYVLVPHVPRERTLALELEDAASVTGVDVAWTRASAAPGPRERASAAVPSPDPAQGGAFRYARGHAPRRVSTTVRLPDGRYLLEVTVERGDRRDAFRRTIDLGDAEQITVPLR